MEINKPNFEKLKNILKLEEGFRQFSYLDSKGIETIGYGFNLRDVGISKDEADYILSHRLLNLELELSTHSFFQLLDDVRKCVLIDMAYNLGTAGLLQFHDMIASLNAKNYKGAVDAMRNSLWYKEVGHRGEFLANLMETGNPL